MKKLWLLAGMLLGGFSFSIAQPYEPMVVEGAHWRYGEVDAISLPYSNIYDYFLSGDTLVDNKVYKKLYWRVLEAASLNQNPPYRPVFSLHLPVAGLREDTTNKLVYGIYFMDGSFRDNPCPGTPEVTLFDFSYELGDTVDLCRYQFHPNDTVAFDTIVSIFDTTFFETQRRVIRTEFDILFVEGVGGGRTGNLRPDKLKSEIISRILIDLSGQPNTTGATFLDHHCVGTDSECEIVTSMESPIQPNPTIRVFPIPSPSLLQVEIENSDNSNIIEAVSIYSTAGVEVFNRSVMREDLILSVGHLPSGIYTLKLTFKEGSPQYVKILIP